MMLARVLPLSVAKEVRALLPLWLGCVVVLLCLAAARGATAVLSDGALQAWGWLVFCGTSVTLGAFSIGHEYTHGTLPLLLAQPSSRARVFLVKLSVLAVMLITLAGVAWGTVLFPSSVAADFALVSIAGGLFVAPWLTMLSLSPLAGTVFTIAIPGVLLVLFNELVATGRPAFVASSRALLAISLAAAVLGWRTFMRLEAIEGRGADLRWPTAAARPSPARRRHPIWLLMKKELGLQQLTFAVAGLYFLAWAFTVVLGRTDLRYDDLFGAMTFANSGLLALLIGSLASAEERHLSTAQWQLLLPMASWKQWIVKAGTALGLAMLLGVALPALLMFLSSGHVGIGAGYAWVILLLTAVSVYASSLSTSGIRALCLSAPVSVFVVFPVIALVSRLGGLELTLLRTGLFAVTLALILYFALVNHRSAERGVVRIGAQVVCIAGCFAFCAVLVAVLSTSHVHL